MKYPAVGSIEFSRLLFWPTAGFRSEPAYCFTPAERHRRPGERVLAND